MMTAHRAARLDHATRIQASPSCGHQDGRAVCHRRSKVKSSQGLRDKQALCQRPCRSLRVPHARCSHRSGTCLPAGMRCLFRKVPWVDPGSNTNAAPSMARNCTTACSLQRGRNCQGKRVGCGRGAGAPGATHGATLDGDPPREMMRRCPVRLARRVGAQHAATRCGGTREHDWADWGMTSGAGCLACYWKGGPAQRRWWARGQTSGRTGRRPARWSPASRRPSSPPSCRGCCTAGAGYSGGRDASVPRRCGRRTAWRSSSARSSTRAAVQQAARTAGRSPLRRAAPFWWFVCAGRARMRRLSALCCCGLPGRCVPGSCCLLPLLLRLLGSDGLQRSRGPQWWPWF